MGLKVRKQVKNRESERKVDRKVQFKEHLHSETDPEVPE